MAFGGCDAPMCLALHQHTTMAVPLLVERRWRQLHCSRLLNRTPTPPPAVVTAPPAVAAAPPAPPAQAAVPRRARHHPRTMSPPTLLPVPQVQTLVLRLQHKVLQGQPRQPKHCTFGSACCHQAPRGAQSPPQGMSRTVAAQLKCQMLLLPLHQHQHRHQHQHQHQHQQPSHRMWLQLHRRLRSRFLELSRSLRPSPRPRQSPSPRLRPRLGACRL